MTDNLDDEKNMMAADRDHAWRRSCAAVLEPVSSKPQLPDWSSKHFDCYAAAAEQSARTAFGVVDDPRVGGVSPLLAALYGRYARGFETRIAADNRSYLVASGALALGLVVLLGVLFFWLNSRAAPSQVAVNNATWCSDWRSALSCPNAQSNAGEHN